MIHQIQKLLPHKVSSIALTDYVNYLNPIILEERKLNVSQLDVFSRLMMDRIIFIGDPIDDTLANIIDAQLLYLASLGDANISLYINTPGGVVSAGLSIIDTMNLVTPKISTICTGVAASMGSILLSSGEKGMRCALPHSKILIHQPLGGASGQASDILIEAKEIEKCRKELFEILANNTGQPIEKIFQDGDRDYWLTSTEAKEYGIIDKIL